MAELIVVTETTLPHRAWDIYYLTLYRKILFDDCLEEGGTKYLCLL